MLMMLTTWQSSGLFASSSSSSSLKVSVAAFLFGIFLKLDFPIHFIINTLDAAKEEERSRTTAEEEEDDDHDDAEEGNVDAGTTFFTFDDERRI